jgi:hypothetical protein
MTRAAQASPRRRLKQAGVTPSPSSPEQFGHYLDDEIARHGPSIRENGIKASKALIARPIPGGDARASLAFTLFQPRQRVDVTLNKFNLPFRRTQQSLFGWMILKHTDDREPQR